MFNLSYLTVVRMAVLAIMTTVFTSPILASSHTYINLYRSSAKKHVFVAQTLEAEYGNYGLTGKIIPMRDGNLKAGTLTDSWKGIGFKTSIGIEIMKFIQFSAGHTLINNTNQNDTNESLDGSRLHAETTLSFLSPLGNLELGLGATASRMEYKNVLESSDFIGTGLYYTVGSNYFITDRFSIFGQAKALKESMSRSGGSAMVDTISTDLTSLGFGFRIWM